jgi:hypothetical protein
MNARTKLIGTIVLGAALLVPVAQAQRPDDRAGLRGPGAFETTQPSSSHPDNRAVHGPGAVRMTPQLQEITVATRPDDRAGTRGPGSVNRSDFSGAASHPDSREGTRGPGAATTVIVQSSASGFDWGDALIGGLGGVGTALLLTGCLFLLMGQRNKARLA